MQIQSPASIALLLMMSFGLASCSNDGPVEEAGETVDEAVDDLGDGVEEVLEDAEDAVD
ncbi:MAG: hypothetical protein P1V81_08875 [Planctomycetota bacterium]|nr:hypothetical protein [Planctomycetota bacterium]